MPRLPPLAAILLLLLLLLSLPASAADDATRTPPVAGPRGVDGPDGGPPSPMSPVRGMRAQAFPLAALGVWAQGHGFALTRRSSIYDIEGGAALRIRDGVRLTASYRMLGIDLGFDSDVEGADGEPAISAPFIGMAFDF